MLVKIDDKNVEKITYREEPVLTLRQIDWLHNRVKGTASRTFHFHKDKFIEDKDYFNVPYEDWKKISLDEFHTAIKQRNPIIFLTFSGYLMLSKSFQDKESWKIMRALVESYFALRAITKKDQFPTPLLLPKNIEEVREQAKREGARAYMAIQLRLKLFKRDETYLKKIVRYRREKELTQKETAKLLDCSRSAIERYSKLIREAGLWEVL